MNRERTLFSSHYLVPGFPSQLWRYRKHRFLPINRRSLDNTHSMYGRRKSLAGYTRLPFAGGVWEEK
jgi:hypothetical protein